MFETFLRRRPALLNHRTGPLAMERERYLQHCANQSATVGEQRKRARCLLLLAKRISPNDRQGVSAARLCVIVYRKPSPGPTRALVLLEFGRPWLKFLGWWREGASPVCRATGAVPEMDAPGTGTESGDGFRAQPPHRELPPLVREDGSRFLDPAPGRSGCLLRRLHGSVVAAVRRYRGPGAAGIPATCSLEGILSLRVVRGNSESSNV
jgi:hypothetical protein